MNRYKAYIILFIAALFLFRGHVEGQGYKWLSSNNLMMEVRGHYGFFYHHHFEMEKFNAHFPAFEASLYHSTYGKKEWQILYNYPYIGCTFYHSLLGGFKELGEVFALYPFINYPLIRGEKAQLTFKCGAGAAWLTNKFDNYENPFNFSIGSHLNAAVNLSFEYRQEFTPRLMSVASFGLTHFSNGAIKSPNYGLNTFSGALGLAYHLRPPRSNAIFAKRPEYYKFEFDGKKWFCVDLDYGIGSKDVSQTMGKSERYLVHDLSARILFQFTTCSRAGLCLSVVKDNSDKAVSDFLIHDGTLFRRNGDDYVAIKEYQLLKPNIGLCYSMTMERMSYLFEMGYHLDLNSREKGRWDENDYVEIAGHSPVDDSKPLLKLKPTRMSTDFSEGTFYQKITIQYFIYDNLYGRVSLTTHLARADFLCLGIGYRFNEKYYFNKHAKTSKLPPGLR